MRCLLHKEALLRYGGMKQALTISTACFAQFWYSFGLSYNIFAE